MTARHRAGRRAQQAESDVQSTRRSFPSQLGARSVHAEGGPLELLKPAQMLRRLLVRAKGQRDDRVARCWISSRR